MINLYNPTGFKPTKLIEAGLVVTFAATGTYEAYMPSGWTKVYSDDGLVLQAADGEGVVVRVYANRNKQSALDWYLTNTPTASPSQVQSFTTKFGLDAVKSPDGLTAVVEVEGNIVLLNYSALQGVSPRHLTTFVMLMNSFSKKP